MSLDIINGPASGALNGAVFAVAIALSTLNLMALIARNSKKQTDTVTFTHETSILGTIDDWARRYKYTLRSDENGVRLYQNGRGLWIFTASVEVSQNGTQCSIKAYIKINGFIMTGLVPLSGGGFMAKRPRSIGKKEVNVLLKEMGQPEMV